MDDHLGYEKYACYEEMNYRNDTKSKCIYGMLEVDALQERESTFEPKILPKT